MTYMLIYKQDGNILALLCVPVKRGFDGRGFGLGVDDEEVLWRPGLSHMLYVL
jgi:hypothetical protein